MSRTLYRCVKDPLLTKLAAGLGSLKQAENELRWLKQELPAQRLSEAVELRSTNYPLQYILGTQPFGSLEIQCAPEVLIPRWETEEWVAELASRFESTESVKFLDICTGTGCVLFGLCDLLPNASGMAVDISEKAIDLFKRNQQALGLNERTSVQKHDLFQPLSPQLRDVDCVVANPPYILDVKEAETSVKQFEPTLALVEPANLWPSLVSRVIESTASLAVFEVGYKSQIELCSRLFAERGWRAEGRRDTAGKWRTVWAYRETK